MTTATRKPVRKNVLFSAIVIPGFNPREASSRPELVASMRSDSWKPEYPAILHDNGDDTFNLLGGECRYHSFAETEPGEGTKIPAIVYSGLDTTEQLDIVNDHDPGTSERPLNNWEEYRAYVQFLQFPILRDTDDPVDDVYQCPLTNATYRGNAARCARLGMRTGKGDNPFKPATNRGQYCERVYRMRETEIDGKTIEEHWRLLSLGLKEKTPLRTGWIAKLATEHDNATKSGNWDGFNKVLADLKGENPGPTISRPSKTQSTDIAAQLPEPFAQTVRYIGGIDELTDGNCAAHVTQCQDIMRDHDVCEYLRTVDTLPALSSFADLYQWAMANMAETDDSETE